MSDHASDPGVYICSMATRGHLGGLAWSAPQAIRVLDAAGCDVILVETVGVGQSEVEIASQADTSVVLLAPGMGDGIQAAKAGILEIGDVYVVNKADRDGADATARELNHMLSLGESRGPGDWRPPIVKTVAARGEGIDEVVEALEKHRAWMEERGVLAERRLRPGLPGGRDDRRHRAAPTDRRPPRRPPPERPRRAHRRRRTGPLRSRRHPDPGPDGELNRPGPREAGDTLRADPHPPVPGRLDAPRHDAARTRTTRPLRERHGTVRRTLAGALRHGVPGPSPEPSRRRRHAVPPTGAEHS